MFPSLAVSPPGDLATRRAARSVRRHRWKMTLVVPTPDRATLGAALTVVARLGVAAGRQSGTFATNQAAESLAMFSWSRRHVRSIRRACGGSTRPRPGSTGLVCTAELPPVARTDLARALRRRAYEGDWPTPAANHHGIEGGDTARAGRRNLTEVTAVRTGPAAARPLDRRTAADRHRGRAGNASDIAILGNAALVVAQGPREGDRTLSLLHIEPERGYAPKLHPGRSSEGLVAPVDGCQS